MRDRKLLELAAKAIGLYDDGYRAQDRGDEEGWVCIRPPDDKCPFQCVWSPLFDDGDALRLAVKLNLAIFPDDYPKADNRYALVEASDPGQRPTHASEFHGSDVNAAVRRAIVRAAAALAERKE